jgi:hypothetical protein
MRDGTILKMQQANARRSALMLQQFEFLQTRQQAEEGVIKASTVWQRLRWVVQPARFFAVVDAVQLNLLEKARREYEAAASKTKIEVVPAGVAL